MLTEVLREDDHGDGVNEESHNLGNDHPGMPRTKQGNQKSHQLSYSFRIVAIMC
jgi:hypothetical protein